MTLTSSNGKGMVKCKDLLLCLQILTLPSFDDGVFNRVYYIKKEMMMDERTELLIGRFIAMLFIGCIGFYLVSSLLSPAKKYSEFEQCVLDSHSEQETHECFIKYK